jgi:membrane-associated phospholipid phosphatase
MLAGLVGLSRLVLGVHWLSDVVAGCALGSAVAIAAVVAFWYITARGEPPTTGVPASCAADSCLSVDDD